MALSLKDPETDRLARQVARLTGESLTEAVGTSLAERLRRSRTGAGGPALSPTNWKPLSGVTTPCRFSTIGRPKRSSAMMRMASRASRMTMSHYAANPASLANKVERLQGRPGFRPRVGDHRVISSTTARFWTGSPLVTAERCTNDRSTDPRHIEGDTVTMVRAEFERLVALLEDAEDVAAFDAAQRRLAIGDEELVPAAIADRLLARDSAVRVWREHRGLAGKVLAVRAGISALYLAQIEAERTRAHGLRSKTGVVSGGRAACAQPRRPESARSGAGGHTRRSGVALWQRAHRTASQSGEAT